MAVSWEERVVEALHIVRLHQITEYDPVQCDSVLTRFCRYNLAYFDLDKESRPRRGPQLLTVSPSEYNLMEESVNVVSLRILESDVGYPIRVSGTVLVRDQVDYKCAYLFRRDSDNPQVISSPEDMLALTDPCRGLAVTCSMFFEINLKMEPPADSGDETTVLSKGVIEHDACANDGEFAAGSLTSWHSTVRLEYTPVPFAIIATLSLSVLHGASHFVGEVAVWTTRNTNEIVLHDSRVPGTSTELGEGGTVALSRRLVAVPVHQDLVVRIRIGLGDEGAGGREAEVACFEGTLGHLDNCRTFWQGLYLVKVEAEWTANTSRENVYRCVGRRGRIRLLV
ncbi:unnamed protein product [Urochloa decumbens]|uniref:DUF6598 domain-containing protein n=1 Tax=Urochloa decumbens TaxID=240449 RepID=A0ABC9GVD9_9POAL